MQHLNMQDINVKISHEINRIEFMKYENTELYL